MRHSVLRVLEVILCKITTLKYAFFRNKYYLNKKGVREQEQINLQEQTSKFLK